jgi:hypothetical protein
MNVRSMTPPNKLNRKMPRGMLVADTKRPEEGRHKFVNYEGRQFFRLTVIKWEGRNYRGQSLWLVKCVCGTEVRVFTQTLTRGLVRSCGCYRKEWARRGNSVGDSLKRRAIKTYINNARSRNLEWCLTEEQAVALISGNCTYCGVRPVMKSWHPKVPEIVMFSGIDRIDSSRGYTMDNVVSCCRRCNNSKASLTIDEWKVWLKRVYKHMMLNEEVDESSFSDFE